MDAIFRSPSATLPFDPNAMLRKTRAPLALLLSLGIVAACQSAAPAGDTTPMATPAAPAAAAAEPSADPTTADGIYTAVQADRGLDLYRSTCSECHDTEDWTETGFRNRWEGQSVFQLWYYIQERMPYENPFSLTRQQVTDVLSYILELNGLPAGPAELGTDDDSIDDYWIAWETPETP